jgi:hypothetical protein
MCMYHLDIRSKLNKKIRSFFCTVFVKRKMMDRKQHAHKHMNYFVMDENPSGSIICARKFELNPSLMRSITKLKIIIIMTVINI